MNNYCLDALQPTPGRTVYASVPDALAGGNAIHKATRESTNSSSVTPSGSFTQVPGISIFITLKCICKYLRFRSFQEKIEKTKHATSISFGIFNTHVMVHLRCYYPNVQAKLPSVYLVTSTQKKQLTAFQMAQGTFIEVSHLSADLQPDSREKEDTTSSSAECRNINFYKHK